jgi:hypothetical protein
MTEDKFNNIMIGDTITCIYDIKNYEDSKFLYKLNGFCLKLSNEYLNLMNHFGETIYFKNVFHTDVETCRMVLTEKAIFDGYRRF